MINEILILCNANKDNFIAWQEVENVLQGVA